LGHLIKPTTIVARISSHQMLFVEQAIDVYDIQFLVRNYQGMTIVQNVFELINYVLKR
jgi:hypothetical protein